MGGFAGWFLATALAFVVGYLGLVGVYLVLDWDLQELPGSPYVRSQLARLGPAKPKAKAKRKSKKKKPRSAQSSQAIEQESEPPRDPAPALATAVPALAAAVPAPRVEEDSDSESASTAPAVEAKVPFTLRTEHPVDLDLAAAGKKWHDDGWQTQITKQRVVNRRPTSMAAQSEPSSVAQKSSSSSRKAKSKAKKDLIREWERANL